MAGELETVGPAVAAGVPVAGVLETVGSAVAAGAPAGAEVPPPPHARIETINTTKTAREDLSLISDASRSYPSFLLFLANAPPHVTPTQDNN